MNPSNLPQPEVKRALLVPAGEKRKVATVHHYYETRLIPGSVNKDGEPVIEYEFIFRCFQTGAERRWGTHCPDQPAASGEVN